MSLAIAVATKLTSRGPILYQGTRIGRNMEPFSIYKFRTLLVDAEQRIGARLLTPGDPLYTPIGRFLKRTKLDEIPQLWNVVRGDMNLVGPRPIRPVFLATSMREIPELRGALRRAPGHDGPGAAPRRLLHAPARQAPLRQPLHPQPQPAGST